MPAVEEAMRWCSSVVVLPRVVLAETVVCDRTITAGSAAMLCFSSSHYDEALHANPEVYAMTATPSTSTSAAAPTPAWALPWRRPGSPHRAIGVARQRAARAARSGGAADVSARGPGLGDVRSCLAACPALASPRRLRRCGEDVRTLSPQPPQCTA